MMQYLRSKSHRPRAAAKPPKEIKMKNFEQTMKEELIKAYVEEYGPEAWNTKTETEKTITLHELFTSFLTVAKRT